MNERYRIRLKDIVMFDWGHIYVFSGIAEHELGLCMAAFRSARDKATTWADVGNYLKGWKFPANRNMDHLFTDKKTRAITRTNHSRALGANC